MFRFAFALFLVLLVFGTPAGAQEAVAESSAVVDPYIVTAVQIDMPISSPQAGRDEALAAAQHQAWTRLQEQMLVTNPDIKLPAVSDAQLNKLMQSFQVAGEKISAKRYIGSYTVQFRPHAIQALVGGSALPASVSNSGSIASSGAVIAVRYQFRSLPEWIETERRLKSINSIQQRELKIVGRSYVQVNLHYTGSLEDLTAQLRSQNMDLQPQTTAGGLQLIRRDAA